LTCTAEVVVEEDVGFEHVEEEPTLDWKDAEA
jgi:hypothetical protein